MNETYEKYSPRDIPELKALWAEVFGDPAEFIDGFFSLLPGAGYGVVCRAEGRIAAMAYVLDGICFHGGRCAYIYAVGTRDDMRSRGFGAGVVRKCASLAREGGCGIVCTSPADAGLYLWYDGVFGAKAAVYTDERPVTRGDCGRMPAPGRPLSAGEYNSLREKLLSGTPHAEFSDGYMELENMLCRVYGGGLYPVGKGAAVCYPEGGVLKIRELLCAGERAPDCVGALLDAFGLEKALVRFPGNGEPIIAAAPSGSFPSGCLWGPALD